MTERDYVPNELTARTVTWAGRERLLRVVRELLADDPEHRRVLDDVKDRIARDDFGEAMDPEEWRKEALRGLPSGRTE